MKALLNKSLVLLLVSVAANAEAQVCLDVFKLKPETAARLEMKKSLTQPLEKPLEKGVVQLTGHDLQFGQKNFSSRGPADPFPFLDKKTGEVRAYGTQVEGTGFSYLKWKTKESFLKNETGEMISEKVYLPNGKLLKGKEALWDTTRVSYENFEKVFGKDELRKAFEELGIDPGSDLYFAGAAIQPDGKLGEWTRDNWRRRNHVIVRKNGKLHILKDPVFNKIPEGASDKDYIGFGQLEFLPGDYIGHAYGPNFKMVKNKVSGALEMWIISEEVTRRVDVGGKPADVTEIVARKLVSPFKASENPADRELLVSVDGKDGQPHPDSDRGPEMGNTKLVEGFRPTSITPEGIKIGNKEAFIMTGSQGNFAGDGYDSLLAVRMNDPIGEYEMVTTKGDNWKKFLKGIKKKYNLSWAGRGSFFETDSGWYFLFHAVDKDIRPDGSYGGVIPSDTEAYHRNIYMVPIKFYVNSHGKVDMKLLY